MKNIHPNDLKVLAGIFFPLHDHLLVLGKNQPSHDPARLPAGQIILAQTEPGLPETCLYRQAAGMIDFGENLELPGFHSRSFDVVKNPDGSIRWLCPSDARSPVFLKLYNGSGWRGWLFRTAFRLAFFLGLKKLVMAGSVRIFYQKNQLLDDLLEQTPHEDFAIFTGTVGDNRKAVIALEGRGRGSHFFKLPLTESARQLVMQEQSTLQELQDFSFQKIECPEVTPFGSGLLLSDVRPGNFTNATSLQPLHLQALAELQSLTFQQLPLCALPAWASIGEALNDLQNAPIVNDLPPETVQRLKDQLHRLYGTFEPYLPAPTSVSHGDFTPWNMYRAERKLHLYDWELSERLPVLFDAFHFIFQSGILIKRLPFSKIREEISALKNTSLALEILENEGVDFDWLYRFYLLRNVSYYLRKYVGQQPLHAQAHWLLNTWLEALEAIPVKVGG